LLKPFYEYGLLGVQVFWLISGFIFVWKYGSVIRAGSMPARRFFWLRVSRLYPLHLVTLFFVAAFQPIHSVLTGTAFVYPSNTPAQFAQQLMMATHWLGHPIFSFNGPSWSISAEVAVYALFFALMRRFGASAWLMGSIVALSMIAMACGWGPPVIACAGYFFAGGLAADWSKRAGDAARPMAGGALAAIVISCVASGSLTSRDMVSLLILVTGVPATVLAAQDWHFLRRWARPLQAAGNLTYASYMIHFPLQLIAATAVAASGRILPVASPWFLLAYLGITMTLAHQVHRRFERPMQDWLRGLTLSPRRTAAA
jgi:peptidoglycan/LPS O-acetylase OafA/YrhL